MQQKMSKNAVLEYAKKSRTKPPIILGNCDFVCREFSKDIINSESISDEHIELYVVNVKDSVGNKYTDGHMVVYLSPEIVGGNGLTVDPTLDQFIDDYYSVELENTNIDSSKDVQIFTGKPHNKQIYEFKHKAPLN